MKPPRVGLLGYVITAVAALMLGLSINASGAPAAVVQPTPEENVKIAGPLSTLTPVPTPQVQVVQLEITVKQEASSPQIIEVRGVQAQPEPSPPPPTPIVIIPPPTPTPIPPPPPTPIIIIQRPPPSTPVPTSTPLPTATPNPCAIRTCATVLVNFFGSSSNQSNVQAICNVTPGSSAWECIKQALGPQNIQYQDYGGALGVFISGLYGVTPDYGKCSCYWEFIVNGTSSTVGVSGYIVRREDYLEFRISK